MADFFQAMLSGHARRMTKEQSPKQFRSTCVIFVLILKLLTLRLRVTSCLYRLRDYLANTTIASICHTLHPVILRHDSTVQEALHVRRNTPTNPWELCALERALCPLWHRNFNSVGPITSGANPSLITPLTNNSSQVLAQHHILSAPVARPRFGKRTGDPILRCVELS